ncbi:MAG: tRNA (adenosine(37)-N6)-threonylcarbamoyltransferase complex dimerization subunit type 1 TsaB [Clostridiales bacterium]|nr:tRNA (adenosine(37)-N6)-threonylcarbamoyltransferase complex dimerization subunit type 1 TsaB [Candidatus Equinaster intestinalis]
MKILAVECSASAASCAIIENGKIIAHALTNTAVTHSQTLMPSVDFVLKIANLTVKDIDAFAVAAGPGSFTGIRIGISAVKGLALPENKDCISVSSLLGMAYSNRNTDGILCAVMDARCSQVYNALFEIKNGEISRLTEDRAVTCECLAAELKEKYSDKKITVTGDGTGVFMPYAENVCAADTTVRYQNACGIAAAAEQLYLSGEKVSAKELCPIYLRLPQAERELKAKLQGEIK